MSWSVEISNEAESDFEGAVDWYLERSDRAALDFARQVRATFDRVSDNPEQYGEVHSGLRRARVRRYPYCVFYRVDSAKIRVVAIMHDRWDPRIWQNRV